jgi:hypothetical protein
MALLQFPGAAKVPRREIKVEPIDLVPKCAREKQRDVFFALGSKKRKGRRQPGCLFTCRSLVAKKPAAALVASAGETRGTCGTHEP